jgi:predicted transcriptional regulator
MDAELQRCQIYAGDGRLHATRTHALTRRDLPRTRTIADVIRVTDIMARDIVCARADLSIDAVTDLLVRRHIGCIPIVDERAHPIGIITKLDLVERTPKMARAGDLMMPLAITLNQQATIAHAAAVMSAEDFHHVMIVATDHTLLGVVSTMDIARWLARNDGFMSD